MSMRIRRRKLAQSPPREPSLVVVCGILPENSTFRPRGFAQNGCPGPGVRHFGGKFLRKQVFVEILANSGKFISRRSWHDPAQVLDRRCYGQPGGVLFKGSLPEDVADAMW